MSEDQGEIVTKLSPRSVRGTVARLTGMLSGKGLKLFAVIDQSAEASAAGLTLRETVLVVFGSPAAGTLVMQAAPLSALDLPLKVLVWAGRGTDEGQLRRAGRAGRPVRAHRRPDRQTGRYRPADRRARRPVTAGSEPQR